MPPRGNLLTRLRRCWLVVLAVPTMAAAVTPRMLLLDGALVGSDLVVVGELGTILRSADGAQSWQSVASPTRATLTGLSFAPDGPEGWAVGHDAIILHTADGGRTWVKQYQGENLQDSLLDVVALDTHRIIAVGAYGIFLATSDAGRTWTRRKLIADDYHLNRISTGPTGTLYVAGEHGTLLRSLDAGQTWRSIATPYDGSFYGVIPLAQRILIAHGLRGRVYRSADDGASWELIGPIPPGLLAAGTKLKSGYFVIAGQARTFYFSRDLGRTLAPWSANLTTALAELIELPNGTILGLGEAGATVLPNPQ